MSTQFEPPETAERSKAAITMRTAELTVATIIAALALLVIWSNYKLGAGWASDGPQAGYFPFRLAVIILISCIVVMVQVIRQNDRSPFVERAQLRLVAIVLLPLIAYIAALQVIGIYVASAIFIGVFMMAIGRFSWWKSLVVGAGISLVFFWIFELQFQVPLPKGPLEHFFGF
jgi:hypothetical protein